MRHREISLLQWLRRFWIMMFVFLAAAFFPLQSAIMSMLAAKCEDNIHRNIQIAESGIEKELQMIDSFLFESLYSSTTQSTSQLYHTLITEEDPMLLNSARTTVLESLQSIRNWSDAIDFILVYTDRDDGYNWLEAGTADNYRQRQIMKRFIANSVRADVRENLSRYRIFRTAAGSCMIRFLSIGGSYLAVSVSEQTLMDTLSNARQGTGGIAFAAEAGGEIVFSSQPLTISLPPESEGGYVTIDGSAYLLTGHLSPTTGYYFGILSPKAEIMSDLWIFRALFLAVFLAMGIGMALFSRVIHAAVEKPLAGMAATMDAIAESGDEIFLPEDARIRDLGRLARAFNRMLRRIQKLTEEKYESRLEAQKATMQYLQLQIKPHFHVNLLNIIYSLAQKQDYAMIQTVCEAVVCYTRYMFRDASELVELRRELEHVKNYMQIQHIRYNQRIECTMDVPEDILSAQVPPFVIQSFVENSSKYAFSANRVCRITVQAGTDAAREQLLLSIRDNGLGYSEDYLTGDWTKNSEAGHIGLTNIHQRLNLIFGDRASIRLRNDGGAVAEIAIPYISVSDTDLDLTENGYA